MAGIWASTARMPSSSLWNGMTTEMRLLRYMVPPCGRGASAGDGRARGLDGLRARAGRDRGPGLLAGDPPPGLAELQARPLLQYRGHHAGVEQDVDREEALVGAEALRLADEAARRLRLAAEPDLPEVVAGVAHVAELAVDEQIAGIDVTVGEHRPAQDPGVAGNLVLVRPHDHGNHLV